MSWTCVRCETVNPVTVDICEVCDTKRSRAIFLGAVGRKEKVMISREPTQSIQANRGGCLTAFLVLMLIANPLTAIYYFFAGSSVSQSLPNMPAWIIPVYGILCVANFVFAIAIWKWKKWGYYGFAISSGTGVISNVMYIGLQPALSLSGLVGVAILAFLLRQVWNQMD